MRHTVAILCLLVVMPATTARAEVIEATPAGFTMEVSTEITAVPRAIYLALVTD
jgi:hypothetical protein